MNLQYETAVAGMRMIGSLGFSGQLDACGISQADYKRFVGDAPWIGAERNRMTQILHSLIMGTVDALGLPRFKVPAEYMAAGIAVFVAPVNVHSACTYAPITGEAELMGRGVGAPPVLPEQLFALVQQLYRNDSRSSARALFERNVGLAIEEAARSGSPKGGK